MRDINGSLLKVGDTVLVPAVIIEVPEGDRYCSVDVASLHGRFSDALQRKVWAVDGTTAMLMPAPPPEHEPPPAKAPEPTVPPTPAVVPPAPSAPVAGPEANPSPPSASTEPAPAPAPPAPDAGAPAEGAE